MALRSDKELKLYYSVNYYFMDLSADDYDRMVEMAANHGNVYD